MVVTISLALEDVILDQTTTRTSSIRTLTVSDSCHAPSRPASGTPPSATKTSNPQNPPLRSRASAPPATRHGFESSEGAARVTRTPGLTARSMRTSRSRPTFARVDLFFFFFGVAAAIRLLGHHDAFAKWRFLAMRAQVMRHELHARLWGQRAHHGEVGVHGHERAAETRRGLQVLQNAREERRVSAPFVGAPQKRSALFRGADVHDHRVHPKPHRSLGDFKRDSRRRLERVRRGHARAVHGQTTRTDHRVAH